ncbi:unnamed protein product [Pleuronectes platessa]|uniref:Uncharacterized protein n=1 Tax=Pleuronectes platessa TaxID=8262 RepID=A0A9N7YHL4_PLEPL|nr:unnamed protein product [Pleuronectes platessa]
MATGDVKSEQAERGRALHARLLVRESPRLRYKSTDRGRSNSAEEGGVTDLTLEISGKLLKSARVSLQGSEMCEELMTDGHHHCHMTVMRKPHLISERFRADSCECQHQSTSRQLVPLTESDSTTEQGGSGHQGICMCL